MWPFTVQQQLVVARDLLRSPCARVRGLPSQASRAQKAEGITRKSAAKADLDVKVQNTAEVPRFGARCVEVYEMACSCSVEWIISGRC